MKKLATLASVVLLAACAPGASVTPSPSPLATPEESISATPSEGAAGCDPGVVCDGPLAAGDYVSETTGAHIEFTLDEHDWSGLALQNAGFSLFLADVVGTHAMSVVKFDGRVFTDACSGDATSTIGATPADFMAFLAGRTGVTATAPMEVEVGGRPALQVDLTTEVDAACEATGGGRIWLWVPSVVVGDFHFDDAETAWVIAVDGGTATVIVVVEAFPDAEYDHLLDHAAELTESMVIRPL